MEPTQDFTEYPRSGSTFLPSGVEVLPPGVHLRAFGDAWFLFRAQWKVWVPAILVFLVLYEMVEVPARVLANYLEYGNFGFGAVPGRHASVEGRIESIILLYVPGFVRMLFGAGLTLMALQQMKGLPIHVVGTFSAFRLAERLLVLGVASTLWLAGGICLCILPGIWVLGALSMCTALVLDQHEDPIRSIKVSREIVGKYASGFGVISLGFLVFNAVVSRYVTRGVLLPILEPLEVLFFCLHYCYFYPERFRGTEAVGLPVVGMQ